MQIGNRVFEQDKIRTVEPPKLYHYVKASGLVDEESLDRVWEGVASFDPAFLGIDPFLTDLSALPIDRQHLQKPIRVLRRFKSTEEMAPPPEQDDASNATIDGESDHQKLDGVTELDQKLADELIRRGFLNRWQTRQFLCGRTKFTLGGYRILDSLGHGGYGHVFLGKDEKTDQAGEPMYVALKVLPLSKVAQSGTTAELTNRFLHEIEVQKNLSHPNLVRFLGSGQDGNVHFMVHEFVNSGDLRTLFQLYGPLPVDMVASFLTQIVRAVHYLHENDIVHRDIKPANVLLDHLGFAKLTDLGLAVSCDRSELHATSRVAGTVDYMAPDQILRPSEPSPAWDIYSLGCTLYQLLTGSVPFPQGDSQQKLRVRLHDEAKDARILNQSIPFDLAQLLRIMLTPNPADRISALEVAMRLDAWCQ